MMIVADGQREMVKTMSEGECQRDIALSKGDQQMTILRAKGRADAKVTIAQAEAEAVRIISSALQDIGMDATQYLVATKYIEAFAAITGRATKRVCWCHEHVSLSESRRCCSRSSPN